MFQCKYFVRRIEHSVAVNRQQQTFEDLTVVCFLSTGAGLNGAGGSSLVPSLSSLHSSTSADSDFLGTVKTIQNTLYDIHIESFYTSVHLNIIYTSLFASISDEFLCDPLPARLGAQQLQFGHDGEVVADRGPEFIKQETQPLDHRCAHLLIRPPLLLVSLKEDGKHQERSKIRS